MKIRQESAEAKNRREQNQQGWKIGQRKALVMSLREPRKTPEPEGRYPTTKIGKGVPYKQKDNESESRAKGQ